MSEMNGKYKQIMQEIEENVKDPETLEFIKEKFAENWFSWWYCME